MKTLTNYLRIALLAAIIAVFCCGLMLPAWAHGDKDHGPSSGDSTQTSAGFDDGDFHGSGDGKPKPSPTPKPGPREGGADD